MLLRFNRIGNEHSDATSDYNVELDDEYPVKEFITHLITRRRDEFGSVTIKTESENKPKLTFKKDETQNLFGFENYLDRKIKSITANGGWGQMHYLITLDSDETSDVKRMNLFSNQTKDNELQVILYEGKDCLYKAAVAKFKHVHEVASLFKDYKNHWCRVLKETPGDNNVILYEGLFSNYFADEVVAYIKELEQGKVESCNQTDSVKVLKQNNFSHVFPMKITCERAVDNYGFGYGSSIDFCGSELEITTDAIKKHSWSKYPNLSGIDYGVKCPVCGQFVVVDRTSIPKMILEQAEEIALS